jgi:hypothetical protein
MRFILSLLLAFPLTIGAATTISFSNISLTNVVKTNDLVLVDSALGGTNYATRTATVGTVLALVGGGGSGNVTASGTSEVGSTLVTKDTSSTNVQAGISGLINVRNPPFNAAGDGITVDNTAVIAAIGYAATNGGIVYFPRGSYLITTNLWLPKTIGDTFKSYRITGDINGQTGNYSTNLAPATTELILRTSIGPAKIVSLWDGLVEIDHIQLRDDTDGTVPFIYTTSTTLSIHDVSFYGKPTATPSSVVQDAIILGGTGISAATGSTNDTFRGYGTIIDHNWFALIQRGVYMRYTCNAVVVKNNNWWYFCGGRCPIEILGDVTPSFQDGANIIRDNLIEMTSYTYAYVLNHADYNQFLQNGLWDCNFFNSNNHLYSIDNSSFNVFADLPVNSVPGGTLALGNSILNNSFVSSFDYTKIALPVPHDPTGRSSGSVWATPQSFVGDWHGTNDYKGQVNAGDPNSTNSLSMGYNATTGNATLDASGGAIPLLVNASVLNSANGFSRNGTNGITGTFTFTGTNAGGALVTNIVTVSGGIIVSWLPSPPQPPTGLSGYITNGTNIYLTWTASSGATGYQIGRSTTSGSGYSVIGTSATTFYTDVGPSPASYYYVVAATNGQGVGNYSSEVSINNNFSPTNIVGLAYWWDWNTLPQGALTTWTDSVTHVVLTHTLGSIATNTTTGVYFASASDYELPLGGITTTNASFWLDIIPDSPPGHWEYIFTGAGDGFLIDPTGFKFWYVSDVASMTGNTEWNNVWVSGGTTYTNGVSSTSTANRTTQLLQSLNVNSGSQAYLGHIKHIGIWTNTTLSATDAANLNTYGIAH